MNMQHIDYVLTLAKERSFSKAAERLFMTQSALSQYIRKQEQQLGVTLFNRTNNPITLTPEGELYVQALQKVKMDMLDFERQLTDLTELRTGKLILGTSAFRATNLLPRVIKDFTSLYPGITLEIITENINHLKEGLASGEIDFCIETDYFEKDLFHCETIYTETHYLAVPKNHPLNQVLGEENALTAKDIGNESEHFFNANPVSLEQCGEEKMIGVKSGNSFYKCHSDMYHEAGIKPDFITSVDNIETAFRWVDIGIAISILPDSLILHGNFKEHPNYYKLDLLTANQNIVFAMRNGRYVSTATKKFFDILRQLIGFGTWNMPPQS